MRHGDWLRRICCIGMVLVLWAGCLPEFASAEEEAWGIVTTDDVRFRKTIGGDPWDMLPKGWALEILGTRKDGGVTWYKVRGNIPGALTRTYTGYIHGDFFRVMTTEEQAAWLLNPVQPTETPEGGVHTPTPTSGPATTTQTPTTVPSVPTSTPVGSTGTGYGITTVGSVNLRTTPSKSTGTAITALEIGTVVRVLSMPSTFTENDWYTVQVNEHSGYIMATCMRMMTADEVAKWQLTITPAPGLEPGTPLGTLTLTEDNVKQRETPGGETIQLLEKGITLSYYAISNQGGFTWYYVYAYGRAGYVRGDMTTLHGSAITTPVVATASPSPSSGQSIALGQIKLIQDKVNLRSTAGGSSITQLPVDTELSYYKTERQGGYTWYYVNTVFGWGYVRSDTVKVLSSSTVPPTAAPTSTSMGSISLSQDCTIYVLPEGSILGILAKGLSLPYYSILSQSGYQWLYVNSTLGWGYVRIDMGIVTPYDTTSPTPVPGSLGTLKTTKGMVNVRKEPGGEVLGRLDEITTFTYYDVQQKGGYSWYYVFTSDFGWGYLRSDVVSVISGSTPSPTPGPGISPTPAQGTLGTLKTIRDKVNLRRTAGGSVVDRVGIDEVYSYYNVVSKSGYSWYYVYTSAFGWGYLRSDMITVISGSTPSPTPGTINTPTPAAGIIGYVTVIMDGVNIRRLANGSSIGRVDKGTVLPCYSTQNAGGYNWYYVNTTQYGWGYIRADMVTSSSGPIVTFTPPPTSEAYLMLIKDKVNLRAQPKSGATQMALLSINSVYPFYGSPVSGSGYTWYKVTASGMDGYVRSDCVSVMSQEQIDAWKSGQPIPTASPSPSPTPGLTNYLITILDDVNLRESASKNADAPFNVKLGTVFKYDKLVTSGSQKWYRISYASATLYVLSTCVRIMTSAEYDQYIGTLPTASPTPPPTPTPRPEDLSDLALTTIAEVIVRQSAGSSGKQVTKLYAARSPVMLQGSTAQADGYTWYSIRTGTDASSGTKGWIRGDLLRILTKTEKTIYLQLGDPDAPAEASYDTLRLGSTGDAVFRLQTALWQQGYLDEVSITGTYLSTTVDAIRTFQTAKKLTVDGVAGSETQHALFGTVPIGTYGGSTVSPTLYPCELVDWYAGDIQTVWAKGETAILTDVKSGVSFRVRRWSGGYHADVEPLTASDTAAMCRVYGVSTAQQIDDNNMYQRRPIWITLDGRTFAASMYGIPHNYPAGDTIDDNDYNGQFCVHFVNSRIHASGLVDADHMAAIQYAYDHAPSRK